MDSWRRFSNRSLSSADGVATKAALVINRQQLEARILSGLRERLMAPELVKTFVDEFNAEIRRSAQVSETKRTTLKRALTDIERKIAGIMRAIEDGNYNPTLTNRLSALEADKAKAETNLANAAAPTKLRIHPNLPALYRRKVEQLQEALSQPATQVEAGEIIRSFIDRIELTPAGGTLAIKLYGDLAQIIAFSETSADKRNGPVSSEAGPLLSVVAGTCNQRFLPNYRARDSFSPLLLVKGQSIAALELARFLALVDRQIPKLAA